MNVIAQNTLIAGVMLAAAGSLGLLRHFLLEPGMRHYPKAPAWLLLVFFLFSSFLLFVGLRYIQAAILNVDTVPPGAGNLMVLFAGMLLFYKGALAVNVMMQRYPVETWKRVNRITDMLRCSTKN